MSKTAEKKLDKRSANGLPLFYASIEPLNSRAHCDVVFRPDERYGFAAATAAVPITLAEAATAQAHYPIVFSRGDKPVPLAVTGLPESGNVFIDGEGRWKADAYVPAYVRRYPFILAKTNENDDTLTLCFDPAAGCVETKAGEGNLFEGDEPSAVARPILKLCRDYEAAARQTETVMAQLVELALLTDGQAQVHRDGRALAAFRGFHFVSEEKLHALGADRHAELVKSGAMALIYAHLLSMRRLEQFAPERKAA